MELLIIIVQEMDYDNLAGDFIRKRISATKFETSGLYLNKKNVTLMVAVEKEREEEIFGYIRKNCTERFTEQEVMEYNGKFMETVQRRVKIGGATVFVFDMEKIMRI